MPEQAGLPARRTALAILSAVLRNKRPLDTQLDPLQALEPRDAGFARALVSQTLRHLGILEAVIREFVPKPPPPHKVGPTNEILLLGACELLILEVPPHAAVDAANFLAGVDNHSVHFKPLINAVLRRVSVEGEAVVAELDLERLSLPEWLWERWTQSYGEAVARQIAAAQQMPPPLDIVLKKGAEAFPQSDPLLGPVRRIRDANAISGMEGFAEGEWWVQDVAATLPVKLFGKVEGRRVIDLCAAPGGKTMQLAAAGANVQAVDSDPKRLERVRENLARTHLTAQLMLADAREVKLLAPMVLVDAPCTATGTIRRHPDLPWIKGAADVTMAVSKSYEILECAAEMVASDGILIFTVCSLEREEGPEQVTAFLNSHPEFSRVPIMPEEVYGHGEWVTEAGDLRTMPFHLAEWGGMDGFYAVRLHRMS